MGIVTNLPTLIGGPKDVALGAAAIITATVAVGGLRYEILP